MALYCFDVVAIVLQQISAFGSISSNPNRRPIFFQNQLASTIPQGLNL
jgi:hypothetical protein